MHNYKEYDICYKKGKTMISPLAVRLRQKSLQVFFWKEFVLKNGKTENQELTRNHRKTELTSIFRNKSKFYYSPKTFSTYVCMV